MYAKIKDCLENDTFVPLYSKEFANTFLILNIFNYLERLRTTRRAVELFWTDSFGSQLRFVWFFGIKNFDIKKSQFSVDALHPVLSLCSLRELFGRDAGGRADEPVHCACPPILGAQQPEHGGKVSSCDGANPGEFFV